MNRTWPRAAILACLLIAQPATAATEIRFWHSMAGALGERLDELVARFNASQTEYRVTASFKRGYEDMASAALGARLAGHAPHVIQVPEAAAGSLLEMKHAFRPVYEVMAKAGRQFGSNSFYAPIAERFRDHSGRLVALPFNSAVPVLFYNKDAFVKAGLDPARAPKTWREVQAAALALRDAGVPCSYTTSWPAWIHLEDLAAWHDEPITRRSNGFDVSFTFNDIMMVRHIALLSSWMRSRIFTYAGRKNEADAKFYDGECGMLTSSSSAFADIANRARFKFGVAPMPYYDEFPHAPHSSVLDGDALWVLSGKSAAEYRGVAKFFAYLTRPEVEAGWHQKTGYLPVSPAAFELSRRQGFYTTRPGFGLLVKQLSGGAPTANSPGLRFGNMLLVRAVIDEEFERVWNGRRTPKEALDEAVERGNRLLSQFEPAQFR
ncbi:MAG: sn-glycerol-3-phosphate ABC transporter substrate-binding protein UgpB [Burkholderiales bacterium]